MGTHMQARTTFITDLRMGIHTRTHTDLWTKTNLKNQAHAMQPQCYYIQIS